MKRVWLLVVWHVPASYSGLMVRLKLSPSRKSPSTFYRYLPNRRQVLAATELLRAAGLHGKAKLVDPPRKKPRYKSALTSREGFGGRLNATPTAGSWRRKTKRS